MASTIERRRNNVRAGVFVTIAIILGLAVIIVLSDAVEALSRRTHSYAVSFDVSSGVANLKPGSDVRVGGVSMGKVKTIEARVMENLAFREIIVEFEIDSRVKLFADATILTSSPLIGADAWLDIPNVGDPAKGSPGQNPIVGAKSIGLLTSLLGSEGAGKADEVIENVRGFSDFLARLPDDYDARVTPILDDVKVSTGEFRETSMDLRSVVSDFKQARWKNWADRVDRIAAWANAASEAFDATIAEGHGLLTDARGIVQENREPIRSAVANVESVTERLNTETVDKFHTLLDTGQQSLDHAVAALEDLRVDYGGWATNIGDALANANLAAQQLKLTTIETRRSPWKLLYRPSAEELEHELLYEAARSFAVAAADLKSASESVQRVLAQHGERLSGDEQAYRRLERTLLNSLENYEKAQKQLLDVILSDTR